MAVRPGCCSLVAPLTASGGAGGESSLGTGGGARRKGANFVGGRSSSFLDLRMPPLENLRRAFKGSRCATCFFVTSGDGSQVVQRVPRSHWVAASLRPGQVLPVH